ncbi:hypothetical protein [Methylobacterium gossipiicola]|uniref:Uncharacterized protein n=1 Tax=Methylobacterium gossipiicola TaxID=582675 RepID=A0A1I2TEM3_9HYPH|nr:hypothetical protein [Methylobacterium gossipiicola]SFG63245.1 hypothetical protein SAMN05192565_10724 [Methylobacterium gossipiicola]
MLDSGFVEGIKLVGGFLGIGTAIFTIWDRLFRNRPWAHPIAVVDESGSWVLSDYRMNTTALIKITNESRRDIVIRDVHQSFPDFIGVNYHASFYGLIASQTNTRGEAVVPSGKSRSLELMYDHERGKPELEKRFWVWIHWKPAGAFFPRFPLVFRTSLKEIDGYRRDAFELVRAQDKGNRH